MKALNKNEVLELLNKGYVINKSRFLGYPHGMITINNQFINYKSFKSLLDKEIIECKQKYNMETKHAEYGLK